jgi:ATP-dependent DNA ligase
VSDWLYEIKLDGYRALAIKTSGKLHLRSRNDSDFTSRYRDCRWLKPVLVGEFEFLEWTADDHLRHSRFMTLREDRKARDVQRI